MRRRSWIAVAAAAGVGLTYFDSLGDGLWWDDYLVLRPWSLAEIAHALHGTWEPFGILPNFYRPLTVLYQAAAFYLAGLNLPVLHAVSLVEMALVAWLLGWFVSRETQSVGRGAVTALFYGVHPAVARSEGPWFFLQYHLLSSFLVVVALLLWQTRRSRPAPSAWSPIWLVAIAGFLIREDMIMVAPALLLLQFGQAYVVKDVPRPSGRLVGAVGLFVVLLVIARRILLGPAGDPYPPGEPVLNLVRGPVRVLLLFQPGTWAVNQAASVASLLILTLGCALLVRRANDQNDRRLLASGALLLGAFNIPLVFMSSSTRFTLLAMSGVLMLTGSMGAIHASLGDVRRRSWLAFGGVLAVAALFAAASRAAVAPARPCGSENLEGDAAVLRWTPVPDEMRAWLAQKAIDCGQGRTPGLSDSVETMVWRTHDSTEMSDGLSGGRRGRRMVIGVTNRAAEAELSLRLAATLEAPEAVHVQLDSGSTRDATLSGDWQTISLPLPPTRWSEARRMHRIDVWLDSAGASALDVGPVRVTAVRQSSGR